MEHLGTENLKKALKPFLDLHEAYDQAKADGTVDSKDLPLLVGPGLSFASGIPAMGAAVKEFKDLDSQERADILAWVKADYDIADDVLEEKVEAAFGLVLNIGSFIGVLSK